MWLSRPHAILYILYRFDSAQGKQRGCNPLRPTSFDSLIIDPPGTTAIQLRDGHDAPALDTRPPEQRQRTRVVCIPAGIRIEMNFQRISEKP